MLFVTNSNILIVHIQYTLISDVISLIVINNDITCSNIFIRIVSHHICEAIYLWYPFSSILRQSNKYLMPYSCPSNLQIYLYLGQLECWIRSYVRGHYTHPGRWRHLPFRCYWPNWINCNNGSCSRTNNRQLSTYPQRRLPAFIPHGIKASLCVQVALNSLVHLLVLLHGIHYKIKT